MSSIVRITICSSNSTAVYDTTGSLWLMIFFQTEHLSLGLRSNDDGYKREPGRRCRAILANSSIFPNSLGTVALNTIFSSLHSLHNMYIIQFFHMVRSRVSPREFGEGSHSWGRSIPHPSLVRLTSSLLRV